MNFTFSEEQQMVAGTVRELLAEASSGAALRQTLETTEKRSAARWRQLTELGIAGVLAPESAGGMGLAEQDLVLVAEECGYAGLPEPIIEQAGVAVPMLAALADEPGVGRWLEEAASGASRVAIGHSINPFVADARDADVLLLHHAGDVHLVPIDAVTLTHEPSVDPFRLLYRIDWQPSAATRIADAERGTPLWDAALSRGAVFAAAQLIGLGQRMVDLAVAYAGERSQFGRLIGSYQGLKHQLATVQVKLAYARPVTYAAAAGSMMGLSPATRISHAKLAAGDAADLASRTALQVHGAMGYSWEVDLHIYLKRTLALSGAWGDRNFHLGRVQRRLFDRKLPVSPDLTFRELPLDI